jgi:hypothetical protein
MNKRHVLVVAAASLAAVVSATADAQVRRIGGVPQAGRQAPPAGVASFGLPSAGGLASPNPAQLAPPGAPSLAPPGTVNLASPGTPPGSPAIDAGVYQPISPGGGAGVFIVQSGSSSATNAMGAAPVYRGPPSNVDIARGFIEGDLNHDGDLSRDEALRIGIPSVRFDELDRNHDGLLSRFEYDDAFR